ncbi:hypothetical protein ACM64Y_00645 [Novispirillum sp. DQ9]|uniref:phage tail assembly chaperone n=1 Tax=Novispirillum sp. DQ9 TaxID=3398612 RepID=UPI003C7ECA83
MFAEGMVDDRVDLEPWLRWIWRAWRRLSDERPRIGMEGVPGPIAWSSVDRWAQRNGINGDRFDFLDRMIEAMDRVYLEWATKEREDGR